MFDIAAQPVSEKYEKDYQHDERIQKTPYKTEKRALVLEFKLGKY